MRIPFAIIFWGFCCLVVAEAVASPRIGICQPVTLVDVNTRHGESLGVVGSISTVLKPAASPVKALSPSTKVELLIPPNHGKFLVWPPPESNGWPDYRYVGDLNYAGTDTFTLRVYLPTGAVEVVYFTQVVQGDDMAINFCKKKFGRTVWVVK